MEVETEADYKILQRDTFASCIFFFYIFSCFFSPPHTLCISVFLLLTGVGGRWTLDEGKEKGRGEKEQPVETGGTTLRPLHAF